MIAPKSPRIDPSRVADRLRERIGVDRVELRRGEPLLVGGEAGYVLATPHSQEELAETLRCASDEAWRVIPSGAGTWLEMGNRPAPFDLILSTRRLNRLLEYEPADLTATLEAGLSLAAFNQIAGGHRQWIPLDPFGDSAGTIGATIATASAGPLRCGYGTPRDWLIGIRVARIDGRLVRAGGKVVKNVAGYDLAKLYTGSLGSLGVITETTFKLRSLPPAEATVAFYASGPAPLIGVVERFRSAFIEPAALELLSPAQSTALPLDATRYCLIVRFLHEPEAVNSQIAAATELAPGIDHTQLSPTEAGAFWNGYAETETAPGLSRSWRLTLLPSDLLTVVEEVERRLPGIRWRAHAASGIVRFFWPRAGDSLWDIPDGPAEQIAEGQSLRDWIQARGGELVQLRPTGGDHFDTWGSPRSGLPLMRALKTTFDPDSLLNPGRFVGGW